jgi:hypothetical protein
MKEIYKRLIWLLDCAGADVNLTITSSYLNLAVMETGEVSYKLVYNFNIF